MNIIRVIDTASLSDGLRSLEQAVLTLKSGSPAMPVAKRIGDYWKQRRRQRDAMAVFDWFLAWALRQEIDEYDQAGERLQLFHKVQIGVDSHGIPLPPCVDYKAFCAQHLDVPYTQVVNWARNVEVYHEDCGLTWEEMVRAGEGKLNISRTYFMANAANVPGDVMTALLGNPHECPTCHVLQRGDGPLCESCTEPMNGGVRPKTVVEYELLIDQLRGSPDSAAVGSWRLTGKVVEDTPAQVVELSVVAFEEVQRRYQPLFIVRIPILPTGVVCHGIPEDMYDLILRLMRRKFPI